MSLHDLPGGPVLVVIALLVSALRARRASASRGKGRGRMSESKAWSKMSTAEKKAVDPARFDREGSRAAIVLGILLVLIVGVVTVARRSGGEVASPSSVATSTVPQPSPAQTAALLTALTKINPGLTVNQDRAVRRARSVCIRQRSPGTATTSLNTYVQQEFEGGTVPDVSEVQADAIIEAVRLSFCGPS